VGVVPAAGAGVFQEWISTVEVRTERGGQPWLKSFHIFALLPPLLEWLYQSGELGWCALK